MSELKNYNVLFVCLGNICRSTMAEGIFKELCIQNGLEHINSDSAATSREEVGSRPDHRTRSVLKKHGIIYDHIARQIKADDFAKFDLILAMDKSNLIEVNLLKPKDSKAEVKMISQLVNDNLLKDVEDPYHLDKSKFEDVYVVLDEYLKILIDKIKMLQ